MEKQSEKKFPIGMVFVLILTGWGALGILISVLGNPVYQLGPVVLTGAGAAIINLVTFGLMAAIFYGIIKRAKWGRQLAIGWGILSLFLSLVNLLAFLANTAIYDSYYQETLSPEAYSLMTPAVTTATIIVSTVISWIIGLLILIYLFNKKEFFVN